MNKHFAFVYICLNFLFTNSLVFAQDSIYARKVIQTLTASTFHGRGYVKNGDGIAAKYIASEFSKMQLQKTGINYYQNFLFGVNTFPSSMKINIDGKTLKPGADYIVFPTASSAKVEYNIIYCDSASSLIKLKSDENSCLFISNKIYAAHREEITEILESRTKGAVVFIEDTKLTWSVGRSQLKIPVIIAFQNALPHNSKKISFKINAKFQSQHKTQNVLATINGKEVPDTFIVITAHYDHLGRMGKKTIFPGANDNASGVAMLLNLAAYYSSAEHQPRYSMLFIAFAGEEAGLVGSKYYTEHPVIPLSKMKFLMNLDLLGTGDEGATVVNATEYKSQFALLKSINEEKKYLSFLGERGKARNSDHYHFSEKGVPSFFMYTMGGIKAYHDIDDIEKTLPLTKFKETFLLIRDFTDRL